MLGVLANWLGLEVDEAWPIERKRELVRRGDELARRHGTRAGLELTLKIAFPEHPLRVEDSGGVTWQGRGATKKADKERRRLRRLLRRAARRARARCGLALDRAGQTRQRDVQVACEGSEEQRWRTGVVRRGTRLPEVRPREPGRRRLLRAVRRVRPLGALGRPAGRARAASARRRPPRRAAAGAARVARRRRGAAASASRAARTTRASACRARGRAPAGGRSAARDRRRRIRAGSLHERVRPAAGAARA